MVEETKTVQQGPYGTEVEVRTAMVVLGEKQFEVEEAPILRSRKWRRAFAETLMPLIKDTAESLDVEFEKPEDLLQLLPLAEKLVVEALDQVVDLLFLYSPVLEADQEYILNHATERQGVRAFQEVIRMAIPFEMDRLVARAPGLMRAMTSSNSPSPNGDSGQETPSD